MLHMGLETRFLCIFPTNSIKAGLEKFWSVVAMPAFLRVMMTDGGLFRFRHYT